MIRGSKEKLLWSVLPINVNCTVKYFKLTNLIKTDGSVRLTVAETKTEANKNGLYRIVWRCTHCTKTDINTDSTLSFFILVIGLGLGLSLGNCQSGWAISEDADLSFNKDII